MGRWKRLVSTVGAARILVVLGGLEIAMAIARSLVWTRGSPLAEVVGTDLLIVLPGLVLVYGATRIPKMDLHRDVYPLIVARCFAGITVLLGVVGLLAISTGLNRPIFTPMAGTAIGSVAGFMIGLNEARAYSRTYEAEDARAEAERHLAELSEERDLRERIVQTSPVGITIVDPDGSVRMVNDRAAQITGLSKAQFEEIDHYNAPMFEATDADGNPIEGGLLEQVSSTKKPFYDVERQFTRADGQRRWLSVNCAPLGDPAGSESAVVFAFKDITERKEYQRQLEGSNERLEQFAYAVSHDLHEPLRMVSSYLQLVEGRYEDRLDENGREFIEYAVDGADRMREMIKGLLEYSRVETEGERFERVDLESILEDACEDLRMKIEESDAVITSEPLPTVEGDESQLRQVFQNLLSNAIEYSGDEPPRVEISAERDDDEWVILASDEGIGIDPSDADRIFEVFQRLHARDEHEGTGIGLAICERIIERHGGRIWVESTPGGGSTFAFTVPDQQEQQPTSATRSSSTRIGKGSK